MRRLLVFIFLCALVSAAPQAEDDIDVSDKELEDIFGKPEDALDQINNPTSPKPPPANSDDCVCVPYYQCLNGTLNEGGETLIDIRIDQCSGSIEICCKPPDVDAGPTTPNLPIVDGCGFRNKNGVGFRITGDMDNESQFGEFPWTGIVLRREIINEDTAINVFQCGCSLIHHKAAVTAAHCVAGKNPDILKLRFGEWDTQTAKELYPHQDVSVAKVIIHEKFYAGALFNDIAVLIFDKPIKLAPNVNLLCLPPPLSVFDGENCIASGWGKDNFSKKGKYQLIMKKVDLKMVSHENCQSALQTTRLGYYFKLHKSFVCAGGEGGKDTCTGDGGSPLVCPVAGMQDRYYHVGIVAWGVGCGTPGVPGVYTNVPLFTEWIEEVLKHNGIQDFYHKP